MKRCSSLSITRCMAMIVLVLLMSPDGCSARSFLRASITGRQSLKRVPGGVLSGLPVSSITNNITINDDDVPFSIEEEEALFFGDFLQQLGSFDETRAPSAVATVAPTVSPIAVTTASPTETPVTDPTEPPTEAPTDSPSQTPTASPTSSPTVTESSSPTVEASDVPTSSPSEPEATASPTGSPTAAPSGMPSVEDSEAPTEGPSGSPTASPTTPSPSDAPTTSPLALPTPSPVAPVLPTPSPVEAPTPTPSALKCDLTPQGRSALINIFLRVVSNPADVDTPGSPQALALNWMIDEDPLQLCPQDKQLIQRFVMAVFYFSTRGDRWTECSAPPPMDEVDNPEQAMAVANSQCTLEVAGDVTGSNAWLTSGSECTWGGIGCNEEDFVVRIEMEQNGVAGTLPHELSRLQSLRNLILEEGILTGTIPSSLSEIRSLEQIDLNFNLLQGPIPEELYTLSNLRQMDLNDNELTGTISSSISGLTKMSFFQIENNLFTGTVPSSIGSLESLEVATMDNNQLSGTMPCSFMNSTGTLKVLTSDCLGAPNRPSPPLVICECCTQCF